LTCTSLWLLRIKIGELCINDNTSRGAVLQCILIFLQSFPSEFPYSTSSGCDRLKRKEIIKNLGFFLNKLSWISFINRKPIKNPTRILITYIQFTLFVSSSLFLSSLHHNELSRSMDCRHEPPSGKFQVYIPFFFNFQYSSRDNLEGQL
jgi:hypothetical protein